MYLNCLDQKFLFDIKIIVLLVLLKKESKINYIEASTLEDAANKAVKALKELENN